MGEQVSDNVGMLSRYRRHTPACPHRHKGRRYIRCTCPIWADGRVNGERINHSLKTRDWRDAGSKLQRLEDPDALQDKPVEEATKAFLAHYKKQLVHSSWRKYRNVMCQIEEYSRQRRLPTVTQWKVEDLDRYFLERDIRSLTASKELQTLRQFWQFCADRNWAKKNIARRWMIKGARPTEVEPYTLAEIHQFLAAAGRLKGKYARSRANAILLLFRFTGLRISDVMTLAKDRVNDGMIHLRTQKNGRVVRLPIPPELEKAMEELPIPKGADVLCPYYLWNGHTSRRQIVTMGHKLLYAVFKKAGVAKPKSHRFRHTLATEILAKGGTLDDVADVLGISSAVARKHYVKWSQDRQKRIEWVMRMVHGNVYERGEEEERTTVQ